MNLFGVRPQHDALNLVDAMLVAPGDPTRSVLLERVSRRGRGQMPPLVSSRVDTAGTELLRHWIAAMPSDARPAHAWTVSELLPEMSKLARGRSYVRGAEAFARLGCVQCHRLGAEGGSVGPDLTGLAKRAASVQEILESILEPAKQVADTYAIHEFGLRDGSAFTGIIEREDESEVILRAGSGVEDPIRISKAQILSRRRLAVSNMPPGMVNSLDQDGLLDLVAYLIADGNAEAPAFKAD